MCYIKMKMNYILFVGAQYAKGNGEFMIKFEIKNDKYKIEVPALTLGTASFEKQNNDEEYFQFLDKYMELGGSCIDTARAYCGWIEGSEGSSENAIGRWLEARGKRSEVVLVTKGGHPEHGNMEVSRLSAQELESDLCESLKALKTGYIDIYFLHRDDVTKPVEEIMPILNEFVRSGRVHFLGASNWSVERIEEANTYALAHGMEPFSVSQIYYSLAHTSKEAIGDETIACMDMKSHAWYAKNKFPVMAFSPQAKGFFSKIARGDSITHQMESQFVSTANLARLARVKQMCDETGVTPAMVALGYLNSQPFPVSSVFSVTKMWQLEEDMKAANMVFSPRQLAFLENRV